MRCRWIARERCPTGAHSRTFVPIARNIVHQLAVYATGAPVRFSDREQIEQILQRTRAGNYGLRSIVRELVQSDLFQTK